MSNQMTFESIFLAISSPASAAGRTRSGSRHGRMTDQSGPVAALASPSPALAKVEASQMNGTSGQNSAASSRSAALQKSLESRLRQNLAGYGSPEYVLTWKHWDMASGQPICALRASQRRISGNVSSGWPTPQNADGRGATGPASQNSDLGRTAGWASPSGRDWKDTPGMATTGINPDGTERKRLDQLPRQATLSGWPSPMPGSPATEHYNEAGDTCNGRKTRQLAGWMTPQCEDVERGSGSKLGAGLSQQTSGQMPSGIPALTESKGAFLLNARFSLWLQGYPDEWHFCGARAIASCRSLQRSSSKRTSKPLDNPPVKADK